VRRSLTALALRRPVTTVMLSLIIAGIGVIAWHSLPLTFLPAADDPFLVCIIPYPGGTPEQVEQQITIPAEGEFRTISGLERIQSTSAADGASIFMQFAMDTDMALAAAEVRARIERLRLKLPDTAERFLIRHYGTRAIPMMVFGLFHKGDEEHFAHLARAVLKPRLQRIEGVANIEIYSPVETRRVVIEFNEDTLHGFQLGLSRVIQQLQENSVNLTAGELIEGRRRFYVKAHGEYRSLEDIGNLIIAPDGLRLQEAATIRYENDRDLVHVSLDGRGGILVSLVKESEANTVAVCRAVNRELADILEEPDFRDAELNIFLDQSELIGSAIDRLLQAGVYGAAMAILVLLFFMRRILPALIVVIAIPASLVMALAVMFFARMTLNLLTLISMLIAVGMLVDNAIVVVENILRRRRLGDSARESAIRGTREVMNAIVAATATTAVVFSPVIFLEAGSLSVFMRQLAVPLLVAIGGSLLIALTLIPLAMSRLPEPRKAEPRNRKRRWFRIRTWPDPLASLRNASLRLLGLVLRQRLAAVILIGLFLLLTREVPMRKLAMGTVAQLDTGQIMLRLDLDPNMDMGRTRTLFETLESRIEEERDRLAIRNILTSFSEDQGMVQIFLREDSPATTQHAIEILSKAIPDQLPGAELYWQIMEADTRGQQNEITVRLRGEDIRRLWQYAENFERLLRAIPIISDVNAEIEKSRREMRIRIDGTLAAEAGISPLVIAQTVQAALRGVQLPGLKNGGREIPVWARLGSESRKSLDDLANVTITAPGKQLVPLQQLTRFEKAASPAAIARVNGRNEVSLTITTPEKNMIAVRNAVNQAIGEFSLPPGYSIQPGRELMQMDEDLLSFASTLLTAIILIYLVMSAVFESFILPLSILTTVPMALIGAVWMLYLTGTPADPMVMIGGILMIGIIVNNGIVIIDHINQLRRAGQNRHDAILQAGADRFRPVLMTAGTTILGILPLAFAPAGGAATFLAMTRALIGGLAFGTLLTLFATPLFYTLIDDTGSWIRRFLAGFKHAASETT
jgi:hydrophobic/amphiphilic exporter-1 (mainly G- bacteria), HAE1 family